MLRGTKLPDILTAVSHEWEDACANLTKAIETYVGATTALAAATASLPPWKFYNPTPALDIELQSLSLGLLELDKARVILAKTRNTQYSTISRLPSELLASIFQIVVDAAHPRNIAESENYANPAVKLGHVCSCWRRVVLEAGSLWSCIVFSYEHHNRYESALTTVQTQLERARGSPVCLFVSPALLLGD
ncbi:hypothetical protein BDV93DRAFT_524728 [Ceratobasidium sp. AG-I]|nr:hypothetical protein BDV93DRAFT_524728 [Ceratobasidium sp. AG-I]